MTEEMIPNDGRTIDINSPTAKNIIEGVIPKAIRTWTIFKNTNNTLEDIEAIAFAIRQVALDEIEKESDNVVFMSDDTVKIIMGTLKRLEQENAKLKEALKSVRGYFVVLENIIPTEMLAKGSGVFGAIKDAKKEIGEVLKDE